MDTRVRRSRVLAVALSALLLPIVAGCAASTQSSASPPAPVASAAASLSSAFGGSVNYQLDGASSTTQVDAVANGASVSGTAVSKLAEGTHTVQLECAHRSGDVWALGGTIKETTVPHETAGSWSAVIVKDGSPQQIGIWLSDAKSDGIDCHGWLGTMDLAAVSQRDFLVPVESGALVPPPSAS